ncbi:S1C family serine protease [Actinacidiphila acididurans]|uniref:Trypsin-like peptidase domain-containing protein n=1 Tax=Actinacidiphila acididurans TaxID=2784346 RepID=A0ABS2TRR9_9ACTN|nr:trypsin-like peptidase domain-containing protein [Actinacidiphila acididurans]MBM9506031.1 trypsin-like peptidase domain-containing protein [Actinacidiphila acididurans]
MRRVAVSTENEAGSSQPAAESAAAAHEGAASDGAQVAPAAPPVPAAPPAEPVSDPRLTDEPREPRTEVLPTQPPVPASAPTPPSAPAPGAPMQAPPPVGPPSPYGPPPNELAHAPHPAPPASVPPAAAPPAPAVSEPPAQPAAIAPDSAAKADATQGGGYPAGPNPDASQGQGQGHGPNPDPYAVPATPAYASSGAYAGMSSGAYGGTNGPEPGQPGGGGGTPWPGSVPPQGDGSGGRRRGVGALVAAVVVAALVAGGVGGGIGYEVAKHNNDNSNSTTISAPQSTQALNRAPTSVAGIANRALPSVVTIKASGSQESGTGTGFVYDTQGHILTNNHVVAPAADSGGKLTVTFSNGNTYDASVVGRAQGYDVAVIKLKNASGIKLSPLPLGNSDDAQVGDATIAIGAPFGLSGTVTTGIVSAVHRPVASSDGQGSASSYMSAIQTDASINPGNSGGPLLNATGSVIGINSAIQPGGTTSPGSQGGSVGLGFAIPINQAKRVADQLIRTGQPVYPVMKVSLDTQYQGDGARIGTSADSVTAGGPGAQAGLKPGDVITKFDDTIIDSGQTLIGEIWTHSPGDKATLTYTRNGSTHTTTVTLGSRVGDSPN